MKLAYDTIAVTLVTGFLGSGKSTLLADVLKGDAARDTAVLVNEFGAVGLDHLLVGEVSAQTVLLDNGCICCAIRGELKEALADLFSRRARGELPPFSRLVLETTGLATPAPIIATLLADPVIRSHYTLNATVTVVDAVHALRQRERHPEWLAQVSAADRLLISKADLVDDIAVGRLAGMLAQTNPAASVVVREADTCAATLLDFLTASASSTDLLRRLGAARRTFAEPAPRAAGAFKDIAHRDDLHTSNVRAFSLHFDEPLNWDMFTLWFTMLLNRHGDKILRVKGLLSIAGSLQPAVLHAVQHLVHPVLHLDAWPDGEPVSRLVFITEDLSADILEASYRRFRQHLEEPAP